MKHCLSKISSTPWVLMLFRTHLVRTIKDGPVSGRSKTVGYAENCLLNFTKALGLLTSRLVTSRCWLVSSVFVEEVMIQCFLILPYIVRGT